MENPIRFLSKKSQILLQRTRKREGTREILGFHIEKEESIFRVLRSWNRVAIGAPFSEKIFTTSLASLKTWTFWKLSTFFPSNNSIIVFTFWELSTSFCFLPLKKIVLWKFPTLSCAYIYLTRIFGPCYSKRHHCTHPFLITLTPPVLNGSSFPLSTLSTLILRAPAGGDPPNYLLFLVYAALEMPPGLSKITDFTIWTFI